jgi:uncharacterized membrane protein (UPF0127 family)
MVLLFFGGGRVWAAEEQLPEQPVENNRMGVHILETGEVAEAAKLVNANGGEWGYVTIPIQAGDRNFKKWQRFFIDCWKFKVIPIVRLATYAQDGGWSKPGEGEVLDMANFLNQMPWPTRERYVVIYNEPNHAAEWGDEVDPAGYAEILDYAVEIFKARSGDFRVLPAGMDAAAPDNQTSLSSGNFLKQMNQAKPGIFKEIDGWTSHSYPNPGFAGQPWENHKQSIVGYRYEENWLKSIGVGELPVFITETGWSNKELSEEQIGKFYQQAFAQVWTDENLMAVTPFVLRAGKGGFEEFSLVGEDGEKLPSYLVLVGIEKIKGTPPLSDLNLEDEENSTLVWKGNPVGSEGLDQGESEVLGVSTRVIGRMEGLAGGLEEVRMRIVNGWQMVLRLIGIFGGGGAGEADLEGKGVADEMEMMPKLQGELKILKVGDTRLRVEIADDGPEIVRGLSGREQLGEDEGMLFLLGVPRRASFWMKEMKFDLDMIWVRDGRVVDISERVPKPSSGQVNLPVYVPEEQVDEVLEVNAGFVQERKIKIGDEVRILDD